MKKALRIADLEHIPSHVFCENIEQIVAQVEELKRSFLIDHAGKEYLLCPVEEEQTPSIERVMDGLLDYAEDERFIKLYKDLCRHVYQHYPKLVGEHVALFRAQFMESGEEEDK